ncbi:MAG: glycoside hydrolase family 6 protein [Thermoleophilaceae bacterium]
MNSIRLVSALALLLVLGALVPATGGSAPARPADSNPLAGLQFYVDHGSPSWLEWEHLTRSGQRQKADLIWKIAREPKAVWVGRFTRPNFHVKVRRIFDSAQEQGAVPILTVLRAQSTGCNPDYDGGGPAEDARTRAWYDDLAHAIGDDRVVIAFEPDSLGTIECHKTSRRDDRLRLLRYGVDALSRNANATIYIEAGASDWQGATRMAPKLRAVGIAKVRGFMLNATHNDWTRNNIKYGLELSRLVGGKHFIINTAENGRGAIHKRLPNGRRITVWCNAPKRGLGPPPTTDTSNPMADAYLWINRPGYAQSCQGRPIAWYLPRALSYARYATNWEAPPG